MNIRPNTAAGLANDVDAVNQYAAPMYAATVEDARPLGVRRMRSEFHNDYLRKHPQEQIFALLLDRNSERLTGFSFQRSSIEEGAGERLAAGEVGVYVREFQRALAQKRSSMAENLKVLNDTLSSLN
ncbi:hypothetical protein [Cupriavidus laharis]|uniref:hypothetical protein n=1 Tax=Cupriavidus laharis TaxID=151654 RepID=UPI001CC79418